MKFAEKISRSSLGKLVYLVNGKDSGRDVWHYVLVDKEKLLEFQKSIKAGNIDVIKYGKVLSSGWGKNPPPDVVESIKKQYS